MFKLPVNKQNRQDRFSKSFKEICSLLGDDINVHATRTTL